MIGCLCIIGYALWRKAPAFLETTFAQNPSDVEPFTSTGNSLGMRFVHFGNLPDGSKVLACIHETRTKDYAAFMADKNRGYETAYWRADGWKTAQENGMPVGRGKDEQPEDSSHPVCDVTWFDAKAFCNWLTKHERRLGLIGPQAAYRLPTDQEWSLMVGLLNETGRTPWEKQEKGPSDVFPWGSGYPPPWNNMGNYADVSAITAGIDCGSSIVGYNDSHATTAPVMSYPPNKLGIYDLGGNVEEWCEDWVSWSWWADTFGYGTPRVLRGSSWNNGNRDSLRSAGRENWNPGVSFGFAGFRCVLVVDVWTASNSRRPDSVGEGNCGNNSQ